MKKKNGLEKRIFALFIIITFILALGLLGIEWLIVRYQINLYEDKNIDDALSKLKLAQNELTTASQIYLKKLASDLPLSYAIESKNKILIKKNISPYLKKIKSESLCIYDKDQQMLYGKKWGFIDKYLTGIFQKIHQKTSGTFLASYGKRLYNFFYIPLYSSSGERQLIGAIIMVKNFNLNLLNLDNHFNFMVLHYPVELTKSTSTDILLTKPSQLKEKIEQMVLAQKNISIFRLGKDVVVGANVNYDINKKPCAVIITTFPRNFYNFTQQSILILSLVLLAATLILVSFLGNWFSKTIMHPIKKVNEKMQEMAQNPLKIEPISGKYSGELGEMIETFNKMNKTLAEFNKSQKEYKVITDHLDSGIFWMDADYKIILCNPKFIRIFERENEKQIIGKNINEFIKLDEKLLQNAKENSITQPLLEINLPSQKKYVILNIRSVKDEAGLRLVGSITDISKEIKEKKAREALQLELIKSNKLAEIGKRVEGIVHNINSPLNSILGYAQLIKRGSRGNEDIDKIIDAGRNISSSVKILLRKVKQDSISMMRPININELVQQELDLCKYNLFFKHYVTLNTDLFENLPKIKAVYGDISQCIANLINNAIETLKDSNEKFIWVRTYLTDKMVAIEVRDSGVGIKEEYWGQIFEPYFTTKGQKDGSGFGLGLAISKNIAERYNGYITVDSIVEEGSTFTLFLPIKE